MYVNQILTICSKTTRYPSTCTCTYFRLRSSN